MVEGSRSELGVTGKCSLPLNGKKRNIPSQIAEASASAALRDPIEKSNEAVSESDTVKWGGAFGTQSIAAGVRASRGVRTPLGELNPNAHGVEVDGQARGSMIREAIERWPVAVGFKRFPELKEAILDAAIFDMKKVLRSKVYCPEGQNLVRYQQVEQFMNMEKRNPGRKREQSAIHIANGFRGGKKLANRIMQREREWVRRRYITSGLQGRTGKVRSMLEDEGTLVAVREYISTTLTPGQRKFHPLI